MWRAYGLSECCIFRVAHIQHTSHSHNRIQWENSFGIGVEIPLNESLFNFVCLTHSNEWKCERFGILSFLSLLCLSSNDFQSMEMVSFRLFSFFFYKGTYTTDTQARALTDCKSVVAEKVHYPIRFYRFIAAPCEMSRALTCSDFPLNASERRWIIDFNNGS